jgi:hypothetical protein
MTPLILAVLLAAGCLSGFLAGLFGVGGGIILVPVLLYVFTGMLDITDVVATHLALGTSLLVVVFSSIASAFQYYRNGHVVPKAVFVLGVGSVVAATAGAFLAATLDAGTLQKIFAAVVVIAAVRLLLEKEGVRNKGNVNLSSGPLFLTGVVTGVVSSLAGVGGGIFSIPIMYSLLHFPLKKALGTSSATIIITGIAAMAGYVFNGAMDPAMDQYSFAVGYVDYLHAIPLIAGGVPMARVGARFAHASKSDTLRTSFAVFLFLVAARMFSL